MKRRFVPICLILSLVLMLYSTTAVTAAETNSASFCLSGETVKCGRIASVDLSAQGNCNIAAFVAQLEYDSNILQFRDASASVDDAVYSTNTASEGILRVVWAYKDGVDISEKLPLLSVEFLAKDAGTANVKLSVTQVVDSDALDVAVSDTRSAVVLVEESSVPSSGGKRSVTEDKKIADSTSDEEFILPTEAQKSKRIFNQNPHIAITVSAILAGVSLVCIAVFVAYRMGKSKTDKQKSSDDI